MTKEQKLILIPVIITALLLIYCWTIILTTNILATWKHYCGLILFIGIVLFFFRNIIITTLALGAYFLLATFNVLAITPSIYTNQLRVGPIKTPEIQVLSLGLFILYFWINFNSLADIYLDYQDSKRNKQ